MSGPYHGRGRGGRGNHGGGGGSTWETGSYQERSRSNSRERSTEYQYEGGRGGGRGGHTRGAGGYHGRGGGGNGSNDRPSSPDRHGGHGRGQFRDHFDNISFQSSRMDKSSSRSPDRFQGQRSRFFGNPGAEEISDARIVLEAGSRQSTFGNNPQLPDARAGPGMSRPRFGEMETLQQHTSMLTPRYAAGIDPRQGGGIGFGRGGPLEPRHDVQEGRGFLNQRAGPSIPGTGFENRQFGQLGQGQGPMVFGANFGDPNPSQNPFNPGFGSAQGPRMGPVAPGPSQFGQPSVFGTFRGLMEPPQSRPPPQIFPGLHVSTPRFPDPAARPPAPVPAANEVEIVVLGKGQQTYAEMVERDVRDIGLTVDVMFPNDNIKLPEFIVSLSQNGTHFAVVIGPENEVHQSVTTHVLRGTVNPEEHRNMPLRECYKLIGSKVNEIKQNKLGPTSQEHASIINAIEDGMFLSDYDYKEIIGAIQKRWLHQRSLDQRTDFDEGAAVNTASELQDRVLKILGVNTPAPSAPLYLADTTKPGFNSGGPTAAAGGASFGMQSGSGTTNMNFPGRNNQSGTGPMGSNRNF